MATPILTTKLYIPPSRPSLVSRPRLVKQLNESLHHKLSLISAPAGFGKTTLVSDWLRQIDQPAAWLSLDEGDNDPARFFSYLIAALQQVNPQIGQMTLAMIQSPQLPASESLMTTLLNELADTETKTVLVLDDYHLIEAPIIHEALTFLLDHLPAHMRLIITSRADPPLPLSRWRGRDQLTELRETDLRFTTDEAATFLNELMGLQLSPEQINALEQRTEGWITGLHLAALSLPGADDIAGFIASFTGSHRYILDYLMDEVLSQQSKEVQTFLLQTSILGRMSGPLCDAITQRENSQTLLETLEAANLFIISLDNERRWYRYHHLFADVLRSRLHQNLSSLSTPMEGMKEEVFELHRRASVWYEQNAPTSDSHMFMAEAINHALVGEDFERAARLIDQIAQTATWQRGEINTVLRWLDRLPHQAQRAWPQLSLTNALLLAWRQQFDEAESLLQGIIESTQTLATAERNKFLGQTATIRATMANLQGDAQQAMGFAQEALEYLPEDDLQSRGISLGTLGGIYRARGEVRAGIQAYAEASSRLQAADQRVPALIALAYLGQLQVLGGQLKQAQDTYQRALKLAGAWSAQKFPAMGVVHINLADLLRERNDLETADHHLREGIELCGRWAGLSDDILEGYLTLARIRQAQGDFAGALSLVQKAAQLGQSDNVPDWITFVGVCQARLWLAQNNLSAVKQWVEERGLRIDEVPGNYQREIEYLTLARLYLAESRLDDALTLLKHLRHEVDAGERRGRLLEILALQALAQYWQSDTTQALLTLSQALTMAEPEGYVRVFVDEGLPMAALLRRARSQGIAPNYVSKLLDAFETTQDEKEETEFHSSPIVPSVQSLIEPLTQREREVLRLMAVGRSNPEIATDLVIAVTTVKTHVKNIYGKLNVDNRFQAVARAKELNLL